TTTTTSCPSTSSTGSPRPRPSRRRLLLVAERCLECGFEYDSVTPASAAETLRSFGARYEKPLSRFLPGEDGDALLRTRPGPWTWSALEYACHVRDVFDVYDERVRRVLTEDRPELVS